MSKCHIRHCVLLPCTALALVALILTTCVICKGVGQAKAPWSVTHEDDLAPASSGVRWAWCDVELEARKGDTIEVAWHADGLVDFYLFPSAGPWLVWVRTMPTNRMTYIFPADGRYKASWVSSENDRNVHINYSLDLRHAENGMQGGTGDGSNRTPSLPSVGDNLPAVAASLSAFLAIEVVVLGPRLSRVLKWSHGVSKVGPDSYSVACGTVRPVMKPMVVKRNGKRTHGKRRRNRGMRPRF